MNWIFHPIKSFKAYKEKRYLKRMIAEAKRMHLITKKQYHVVPIENGRLEVVDNLFLKNYNKADKSGKITGVELRKMALYSTPLDGLLIKLEDLKNRKQL